MKQGKKDWFLPSTVGAAVLLIGGGLGLYFLQRDDAPPAPAEPIAAAPPPAPTLAPPPVAPAPIEQPPRALPLPPLDGSDAEVQSGLTELLGQAAIAQFLVPERIVRNIVVTIDNLPRQQLAVNQRPIKPTPGDFITSGPEDALLLAPENYARYTPFITVVRNVDAKTLVSLYRGLQPLFQQAYEDLGHPNDLFNIRLLEVIEHLLATDVAPREIRLVQPSVHYRYADERLEKLSAGQKLLLRMGPENAAILKGKLRQIQAELL